MEFHALENQEQQARQKLLSIDFAHMVARSLHVVAELKVADYLVESPKTIDELAQATKTDKAVLYRVLRILVTHEVFDYTADCKFKLNETSMLLTSNHPSSLRAAIAKEIDVKRWNAVGGLLKSLKTGNHTFNEEYGETFYEYLEKNQEAKTRFDAGMSKFSEFEDKEIVNLFDFNQCQRVIDVGGNQGSLGFQILKKYQNPHLVLFDLPGTVEHPKYLTENTSFEDRYTVVGGSFFDDVPKGDAYVLKRVIHNWNDADAVKILKNCVRGMTPSARVLIIDCIEEPLNEHTKASPFIDGDIIGVVIGGYERTKENFEKILSEAQLEIVAIHQSPKVRVKVIEAKLK